MIFNPNNPPAQKTVTISAIRVLNSADPAFSAPSDIEVSATCDEVATTIRKQGLEINQVREIRDECMVVEITLLVDQENNEA